MLLVLLICAIPISGLFYGYRGSRRLQLSLKESTFNTDMIFDDALPEGVRRLVFEMQMQIKLKEKEIEIIQLKKDNDMKDKEIEIKDKEIEIIQLKTEKDNLLTKMMEINDKNALMAPRGVLEYVEQFEFPNYEVKGGTRAEKWEYFFKEKELGKSLFKCLKAKNTGWTGNEKNIASKLDYIYQASSDYHHSTSLEISESRNISIPRLKETVVIQTFNTILCIAEHFQLHVSS